MCCQRFRLTTGVSPLVTAVLVPGCRFDSAPRHLGSPGRALGVLPALWGVAHPLCLPRCLPLPPLRRPPAPSILPSAALPDRDLGPETGGQNRGTLAGNGQRRERAGGLGNPLKALLVVT